MMVCISVNAESWACQGRHITNADITAYVAYLRAIVEHQYPDDDIDIRVCVHDVHILHSSFHDIVGADGSLNPSCEQQIASWYESLFAQWAIDATASGM